MENKKELYLCFLSFPRLEQEPFKIMLLAVASSEDEAVAECTSDARRQEPADTTSQPHVIECMVIRRRILEQAAREVLGWYPPDQSF